MNRTEHFKNVYVLIIFKSNLCNFIDFFFFLIELPIWAKCTVKLYICFLFFLYVFPIILQNRRSPLSMQQCGLSHPCKDSVRLAAERKDGHISQAPSSFLLLMKVSRIISSRKSLKKKQKQTELSKI